jgi:hypothetical protein
MPKHTEALGLSLLRTEPALPSNQPATDGHYLVPNCCSHAKRTLTSETRTLLNQSYFWLVLNGVLISQVLLYWQHSPVKLFLAGESFRIRNEQGPIPHQHTGRSLRVEGGNVEPEFLSVPTADSAHCWVDTNTNKLKHKDKTKQKKKNIKTHSIVCNNHRRL